MAAMRPWPNCEIRLMPGFFQCDVIAQQLRKHEVVPAAEQVIRGGYVCNIFAVIFRLPPLILRFGMFEPIAPEFHGLTDRNCVHLAQRQMPYGCFPSTANHHLPYGAEHRTFGSAILVMLHIW